MAVAKRKSYKEKKEYIDNSKEKLEGFLADKVDSIHAMLKSQNPIKATRRERVVKVYKNPHTGETIETKGGNHRQLKEWKSEFGADTVESWLSK
jgi:hypothetical protein